MEQFRKIGEALGSMKALMVFQDNIQINHRQCCLLVDMFSFAYDTIAEEMRQKLKFKEKSTKWKSLEQPLKELHRIYREGETYIRQCLENNNWWAKAIILSHNTDCIEFHIQNLYFCLPIVIEAIEFVEENSGSDHDEIHKKKLMHFNKYHRDWMDPKLFEWKFGKQYLITQDFCQRLQNVCKEDRWILLNKIRGKTNSGTIYKQKLANYLLMNLDDSGTVQRKLLPFSILVCAKDYQVRRRIGSGSQYKEITWLGENLALRHFFADIDPLIPEISSLLSLSHPHILNFLCGFTDDDKKECFLVMELMNRDLCSYTKEIGGLKKRIPFTLPVAVDLMLQIARGMEYLHSKKIYHGDLNPSKILVKGRENSKEGFLNAKISGFGLSSVAKTSEKGSSNQNETPSFIWHAPEVLEEQEKIGTAGVLRYTEKADVYSFGMVCFELLTGKVPFEDSHLQGEKMSRNIRAGERPLFPFSSPKYITHLTKKCWHSDPKQRPSFCAICRILRNVKRFLVMNPNYNDNPDQPIPPVDYSDIDAGLSKKFSSWDISSPFSVSQIPFQMFASRVIEKEKIYGNFRDTSGSESEIGSVCGDESPPAVDEPFPSPSESKSSSSPESLSKRLIRKSADAKLNKAGTPKGRAVRPPQMATRGRSLRTLSETQLTVARMISPRMRRSSSGHISDSELS